MGKKGEMRKGLSKGSSLMRLWAQGPMAHFPSGRAGVEGEAPGTPRGTVPFLSSSPVSGRPHKAHPGHT